MVTALFAHLVAVPTPLTYAVIAVLVFVEAAVFVGFVVPGETAVLLGGALAATGHLSLLPLLGLVVVAGVLGDSVGFEVGRRLGPRLMDVRLLRRHRARLESAQSYLRRRGGRAVVLGRFTAFLRAVMPALAGASSMSYRRFLAFNVTGGVIWGTAVTLLGFFAGQSFHLVQQTLGGISAVLITAVVVSLVVGWHRRRRARAAAAASSEGASEPEGELVDASSRGR